MNLKTKITWMSAGLFLAFLLIIQVFIYFSFKHVLIDREIERVADDLSVVMEAFAGEEVSEVDPFRLLNAYVPTNGLIRIVNANDEAIQIVTRDERLIDIPVKFVSGTQKQTEVIEDVGRVAKISMPMIYTDNQVRMIETIQSLEDVDDLLDLLMIVLVISFFVMFIPAVLIGRSLSHLVIRPLSVLSKAMRDNQRNGEWKSVKLKHQNDEIGQLVARYNTMNARLQTMFEQQQQFVSNASHELKTPLAVIKSYARLVERQGKEKPEVLEEGLATINSETDRMDHLIRQMLLLSTLERKEGMTVAKVELVGLIKSAIRSISMAFERTVNFNYYQAEVFYPADESQLNQLIYILLDNARKYSENQIDVALTEQDQQLIITVTDYGEGIPEEDRTQIFNRFYRVDRARNRKTGGTGLGLTIAKAIVVAHSGEIEVMSELGKGTTFRVILPK